jgi:TolA-binding protein
MAKTGNQTGAAKKGINYKPIAVAASMSAFIFLLLLSAEVSYVSSLQHLVSGLQTQIDIGSAAYGYTTTISSSSNSTPDLQSQIAGLESQISRLQSKNSQLQNQVSSLQSTIQQQTLLLDLQDTTTEATQQTITEGAAAQTQLVRFNADYAGYIIISGMSTIDARIIVNNESYGVDGGGFSVTVPVAPGSVAVSYDNVNQTIGATATMSVIYYS